MNQREERVIQWAKDRQIIQNSTPLAQFEKLQEEIDELKEALESNDMKEAIDAIGDSRVVLTIIANMINTCSESCDDAAWNEIKDRKGYLNSEGIFVKEV